MYKKRSIASVVLMLALVASLAALAACSQSQQSSSSKEVLEANDAGTAVEKSGDPYYVLVAGIDSRIGTIEIDKPEYSDGTGRSDTIMLARVDPTNYKITLVTVPRDTQDELYGMTVKINERYRNEGIEGLLDGVELLTGVRPKYYLTTTFVGFEDLVNKLGGLSIYVPYDQSMTDIVSGEYVEYPAGDQTLDGAQALVFARERKHYNSMSSVGGEPFRQSNDRMIVQTMIKQILSNAETAPDVTRALLAYCETNWATEDLVATVEDFAENADKVTFLSGTGPYEGGDSGTGAWMAYRDEDTWRKVIETVDAGGDPSEIVDPLSLYE